MPTTKMKTPFSIRINGRPEEAEKTSFHNKKIN